MLYEDDFEFEEQPANIRDRDIPGKSPRRRDGGGGRRNIPRPPPAAHHELPEEAKPARALLDEILERMGITNVEIAYIPRMEGEYLEISGPELAMLIGRHGATLEALNLVFNNILNAGVRNNRKYFTIDAEGYRARRADQLRNLALVTLERAMREKQPQKMEPMLPSERKIIHLSLAENQYVRTESEGVEPERCVVIFPK